MINSFFLCGGPGRLTCCTILLMLISAGCQTTVLHFEPPATETEQLASNPEQEPTLSVNYVSLGLGIYEFSKSPKIPCPNQIQKIVISRNWLDATIHFFVGGVYSTRRIDFYCKTTPSS